MKDRHGLLYLSVLFRVLHEVIMGWNGGRVEEEGAGISHLQMNLGRLAPPLCRGVQSKEPHSV